MKHSKLSGLMLLIVAFMVPQLAKAQYTAYAGAETKDESVQADAFLPNELWILAGDSITWKFVPKNEVHTVTFLAQSPSEQSRPSAPPPVGPPAGPGSFASICGALPTTASYDGSTCVSSAPVSDGASYTVTFPTPGNYKLVCLVHTDMNGTVHVLARTDPNAPALPSQQFYDDQARDEAQALLSDDDHQGDDHGYRNRWTRDRWDPDDDNEVIAGIGHIVATGGGTQYRAVVRFLPGLIRIRAGGSVLFTNVDPTEPHTITFGTEPPGPPSTPPFVPTTLYGVTTTPCSTSAPLTTTTNCTDPDTGTVTGTINCPNTATCDADFVQEGTNGAAYVAGSFLNSGFVQAQAPDRTGSAQLPPGMTRIRITFPIPGNYYYHCALHDVDGMYGEVIVDK